MWIYVMRHGIAHDRDEEDCPPDAERRLTDVGRSRTRMAARGLAATSPEIDLCVTSPYLRATETMTIAVEELRLDNVPLEVSEALVPMAEPDAIVALLRARRPTGALLVGHGPHVDRLLTLMLTGRDGEQTWLKKAGVALLETKHAVEPGQALLRWLIPPKALRALA